MSDSPSQPEKEVIATKPESCSATPKPAQDPVDKEAKEEAVSSSASGNDSDTGKAEAQAPPAYCALSPGRRRFILSLVTLAGALGPLSGAIYLPVLPLLEREFNVSSTSINATVSVFMVTFAFAVSQSTALGSGSSWASLVVAFLTWNSRCSGLALPISKVDGRCTSSRWRYSSCPMSSLRPSPRILGV